MTSLSGEKLSASQERSPSQSTRKKLALSLLLPCYNEAEGIAQVVSEMILPVLRRIFAQPLAMGEAEEALFEVLLVDDGSKDATYEAIAGLCERYAFVRGIRFSRNFGKEAAILAGLEAARGEAVVVMDSDGQHPPEVLEQMWAIWQTGRFDLISGVKQDRSVDSRFGRLASALFYGTMRRLTRLDLKGHSDFKLMRDTVVQEYLAQPERMRFFRALVPWLGFRQAQVPFVVAQRVAGTSRWSLLGLFKLALTAITSFTGAPLYWSAYLGAFGMLASFLLALQAMYSWATGIAVQGWTSLTMLLLFFGSSILLSLGLMGVYLHQIFQEVKARKPYIVSERSFFSSSLSSHQAEQDASSPSSSSTKASSSSSALTPPQSPPPSGV